VVLGDLLGNINVGGLMLEETHVIKVPNINGVAISESIGSIMTLMQ
jgi:hypothetical protein